MVVLTARNEARGLEAVDGIRPAGAGHSDVVFHQLDVTDPSSVSQVADFVRDQFGRLDVLINNAGISGVDRDPVLVAKVKDQNFNSEDLRKEFDDIDNLTENRLEELLDLFLDDFKANLMGAHGWPTGGSSAYKVAKAALNAYTRILAKKYSTQRINCLTPGYVKSDMSMHMGVLTPEEGASNPVKVALLPDDGPTGAYFDRNGEASFVSVSYRFFFL
ncbi:hypothetical protein ABZP36_004186 [Zizania latifolia]